jgi:hypothetical protein
MRKIVVWAAVLVGVGSRAGCPNVMGEILLPDLAGLPHRFPLWRRANLSR